MSSSDYKYVPFAHQLKKWRECLLEKNESSAGNHTYYALVPNCRKKLVEQRRLLVGIVRAKKEPLLHDLIQNDG